MDGGGGGQNPPGGGGGGQSSSGNGGGNNGNGGGSSGNGGGYYGGSSSGQCDGNGPSEGTCSPGSYTSSSNPSSTATTSVVYASTTPYSSQTGTATSSQTTPSSTGSGTALVTGSNELRGGESSMSAAKEGAIIGSVLGSLLMATIVFSIVMARRRKRRAEALENGIEPPPPLFPWAKSLPPLTSYLPSWTRSRPSWIRKKEIQLESEDMQQTTAWRDELVVPHDPENPDHRDNIEPSPFFNTRVRPSRALSLGSLDELRASLRDSRRLSIPNIASSENPFASAEDSVQPHLQSVDLWSAPPFPPPRHSLPPLPPPRSSRRGPMSPIFSIASVDSGWSSYEEDLNRLQNYNGPVKLGMGVQRHFTGSTVRSMFSDMV